MATSKLNIDTDQAQIVLDLLNKETKEISDMFEEIEFMMDSINGEEDTWKGVGQQKFYENFKTISKKFPDINKNLEKNNDFLKRTIEDYRVEESKNNQSEIDNDKGLDINK